MKKRTVGIYAKYDASEQSLCALSLINYIITRYRYVVWFTPKGVKAGDPAHGFSHQWDSGIVPKSSPKCNAKLKDCDTFFFFEPDTEILDILPKDASTSFIIDPYNWNSTTKDFAKACTHALLLSPDWMPIFSKYYHLPNLIVWTFEPVMQGATLRKPFAEKELRLFYQAYGFPVLNRHFVKQVAELVRLCRPKTKSVIGFYDAAEPSGPGYDARAYDWRLHQYIQNCDWIVDLNPQPLFGYFPSCASSYGLRWLGFGIPPYTDIYSQTRRYLIETKTKPVGARVPKAILNAEETAAQIIRHLDNAEKTPKDINYAPGAWERRSEEFLRVTDFILGVRSRH
jgi:hypothetical protein